MTDRAFGWKADQPDIRDHLYRVPQASVPAVPVDLRPGFGPIYDQGQLGACVAWTWIEYVQFVRRKEGLADFEPAALFVYYNGRVLEHTTRQDSGLTLRDGIKAVAQQGAPPLATWPYDIAKFKTKPPKAAYAAGALDLAITYESVPQSLDAIRACLQSGYPVAIGFTVYSGFMGDAVARTGRGELPQSGETVEGGHAVNIVGDRPAEGRFLLRNHWAASWGEAGYFTLPYSYITNPRLASDFWKLTATKG